MSTLCIFRARRTNWLCVSPANTGAFLGSFRGTAEVVRAAADWIGMQASLRAPTYKKSARRQIQPAVVAIRIASTWVRACSLATIELR